MRFIKRMQRRENPYNNRSWTQEKVERIQAESREGTWVEGGTMRVPNTSADDRLASYQRWLDGHGDDEE